MLTPHDWQEAIGARAAFIEGRLVQGSPILAVSVPDGVVIFTYRRNTQKIYEVYDRLAMAAIGQQSDVEVLRTASIDFAHQEGFNRSESDVTLRRVVTAMSAPIKRAFADFQSAPFVVRSLFAEVCQSPESDSYAILDYEGDFKTYHRMAYVLGSEEPPAGLVDGLREIVDKKMKTAKAYDALKKLWDATFIVERPEGFAEECVLLERDTSRSNRFRVLSPDPEA